VTTINESRAASEIAQFREWLTCGWMFFKQRPDIWYGMGFYYLFFAVILSNLPLIGLLLLVLVTPMFYASTLVTAEILRKTGAKGSPQLGVLPTIPEGAFSIRNAVKLYLQQPLRLLFRSLADEQHLFGIVLMCVLITGFVLIINVLVLLMIGSTTGASIWNLISSFKFVILFAMLVALILYQILIMANFYVVHLMVLRHKDIITALQRSFVMYLKHFPALFLLTLSLVLAFWILKLFIAIHLLIGYLLMFLIGPLLIALFVSSVYCSYIAIHFSTKKPAAT
jgi:hypothetical protein